jgi:hypothetical protein
MSNFIIDTKQKLRDKEKLVESLGQIEIATKLLQETHSDMNEIDSSYKKLNTDIKYIEKTTEEYKLLDEYLQNSHGDTHRFKTKIIDAFKIDREGESAKY